MGEEYNLKKTTDKEMTFGIKKIWCCFHFLWNGQQHFLCFGLFSKLFLGFSLLPSQKGRLAVLWPLCKEPRCLKLFSVVTLLCLTHLPLLLLCLGQVEFDTLRATSWINELTGTSSSSTRRSAKFCTCRRTKPGTNMRWRPLSWKQLIRKGSGDPDGRQVEHETTMCPCCKGS